MDPIRLGVLQIVLRTALQSADCAAEASSPDVEGWGIGDCTLPMHDVDAGSGALRQTGDRPPPTPAGSRWF